MKKIIAILIIMLTTVYGYVSAQDSYTSVNYVISFPTGDLGDYASGASFRGFLFEYRGALDNDNIGVGVDLGWNAFYAEMDYETYTQGTVSITGKQWRYSNCYPILGSAEYYFNPGEDFNPYVNFGLGTMYTKRQTLFGAYVINTDAWHFAIKPEVGFMYNFMNDTGVKLAVKYYTAFKTKDIETQSYFALSLGFVFKF